ncbi:uncharacterized protein TNCV_2034581 [Trichonephila clavipes]|nr:uncharacterized protein TNCV_2034581 [Trichonephila clavipes]
MAEEYEDVLGGGKRDGCLRIFSGRMPPWDHLGICGSTQQRSVQRNVLCLGKWNMTRRSNLELYQSYKESDIVNFIKIQRIKWAGHVIRMNEDRTTKKVFSAQPIGTRRKGRPNLRWIDGLEKDLLV